MNSGSNDGQFIQLENNVSVPDADSTDDGDGSPEVFPSFADGKSESHPHDSLFQDDEYHSKGRVRRRPKWMRE